jgi:hypothetical protein
MEQLSKPKFEELKSTAWDCLEIGKHGQLRIKVEPINPQLCLFPPSL